MSTKLDSYKIIFLIYVLSIVSIGVNFSQELVEKDRYEFSVFNDSWGGGIVRMPDDYRTFGFDFSFTSANKISLYTKYSSFTNRYDSIVLNRKRLDEIVFKTTLPIVRLKRDNGYVGLILGVYSIGNFKSEELQNYLHEKYEIPTVDLPYDEEKGIYYTIGIHFFKDLFERKINNDRKVTAKINVVSEYTIDYLFSTKFSIPILFNYTNNSNNFVALRLGYNFLLNLGENQILNEIIETEYGLNFNAKLGMRNVFLYYEYFPNRVFSSGGFGFSFVPGEKTKPIESESEIEVSIVNRGYGYNIKYIKHFTKLFKRQISFIINHNFHTLLKSYIPKYPKYLGHGNQISLGIEADLLNGRKIFNPYINLSFGYKLISLYSGQEELERINISHFIVQNDTGIKIRLPFTLFSSRKSINLLAYHRYLYLSKQEATKLTRRNQNPHFQFQSRWGGGFIFDF